MASSVPIMHGQSRALQSRVVRSSGRAPVVAPSLSTRLPTYNNYSTDSMLKAYEAVLQGEVSVRRASELYGVPRTTLQDRVSGKVSLNARSGAGRLLTDEEESTLVEFLIGCTSIG